MEAGLPSASLQMSSDAESFWQAVERIDKSSGAFAALVFILLFLVLYFGLSLLAAWAVSTTINSPFWLTALSIFLLKLVFS